MYGKTKYVNIADKSASVDKLSDEMQVFDLPAIPDSLFEAKYHFKSSILVAGAMGYPLVIGDFNRNGLLDFAGIYKVIQDYEIGQGGIAELQENEEITITHLYNYGDSATTPLYATDLDNNGLLEMNIKRSQDFYNYEALSDTSLPDSFNFKYRMWEISGAIGSETFLYLDNDDMTDIVYVGDDSTEPYGQKIFVAEYQADVNNFVKRFAYRPDDWRVSGISVGDFDNDGYKEFVTGSIHGVVYVFENSGDNTYQSTFIDSIGAPNAYLTCATNDMDKNGKSEFFVGGSAYYNETSGTKIYWFEADGDNNYKKIRSIFLIGTGVLGTTELYNYDVNADGTDDLVFAFAGYVFILNWNNDTKQFDVFYKTYINLGYSEIQSANIYDVSKDGRPDLLISIVDACNEPRSQTYYYENKTYTSINETQTSKIYGYDLLKNYPNPFNNATTIVFNIPKPTNLSLSIYNLNGRHIVSLINDQRFTAGRHKLIWNGRNKQGKEVSSGVYFVKLQNGRESEFKKLLLVK